MKTRLLFLIAIAGVLLLAQAPPPPPHDALFFQEFSVMGGPESGPVFRMMGMEAGHGPTVTGKPMSATEQHHSLQVLADGTRIEKTETNNFYRDEQGRTRMEHTVGGTTHVMIHDPVAGYGFMLDPVNKIAHKAAHKMAYPLPQEQTATTATGGHSGRIAIHTAGGAHVMAAHAEGLPEPVKEDLGTQTINGVVAHGTRTTLTIPTGKIGNDRPLQVVNERWYSDDLHAVVKSTNNDPRFGETDYEMANIDRSVPAASLFQIPSDYKVQEGGERFGGPHPPAEQ